MKYRVWLSILLCISLLAGCSLPFDDFREYVRIHGKKNGNTLGLAPDFSYKIEEQTPNILVNQAGYEPQSSKTVLLQGKELEPLFQVYHKETKELVYEGILEKVGVVKSKEELQVGESQEAKKKEEITLYVADFSNLKEMGEYYIFHSQLGYSYSFPIKEGIYMELEKEILTMLEKETFQTSQVCYQTAGLLMAMELYGEEIQELKRVENICKVYMESLLTAQDKKSGSVYAQIPKQQKTKTQQEQKVSLTATAEFAGTMAMYSYYIQKSDTNLAREYKNVAEKAYDFIQKNLDNVSYDAGYFAATQLYRLTGNPMYEQAVGQYLFMQEEQKSYTENNFSLFGDLAYLSCKYGINLEWSEAVMKAVMNQAVSIADASTRSSYYISENREYDDINSMLQDVSVMSLVNYIITNHEYTTLLKNYLDYMLGRNPKAVCMISGIGQEQNQKEEHSQQKLVLFYLLLQSIKVGNEPW